MKGRKPLLISRTDKNHAADTGGVVLRATRDWSPAENSSPSPLSNVILLANWRTDANAAIPVVADAAMRPLPWWNDRANRIRLALFLTVSLAAHGALFAFFNREPEPFASIGIEAISVEIVLGDNRVAGAANTPSQDTSDVQSAPSPDEKKPEDSVRETARKEPEEIRPDQPEESETRPPEQAAPSPVEDAKAENPQPVEAETPQAAPPEAQALHQEPTPEPQQPEIVAQQKPSENPTFMAPAAAPQKAEPKKETAAKPVPKKPRSAHRSTSNGTERRDRAPPASEARNTSSGIGMGRSNANSNYVGIVRAHIARFARAPGEQGRATIGFSLDSGGSVTSVRLVSSSGSSSLDQAAVATARRASPFPAPPPGAPRSFTLPIVFGIR